MESLLAKIEIEIWSENTDYMYMYIVEICMVP